MLWCYGLRRRQSGEIKCWERLQGFSEWASPDAKGSHYSRWKTQRDSQIHTPSLTWFGSAILGDYFFRRYERAPWKLLTFLTQKSLWEYDYPRNMHADTLEMLHSLSGLYRPPNPSQDISGSTKLRAESGLGGVSQVIPTPPFPHVWVSRVPGSYAGLPLWISQMPVVPR